MIISKIQKEIINDIAEYKVKDLNSFYYKYFLKVQKENIASDIIGFTSDKLDLPSYCSIANTTGIIFDDSQNQLVIDFIEVWKKLEAAGMIYTAENNISPFLQRYACLIPMFTTDKREAGKFNNITFYLTKDYMNKVITVKEELKVFVTNGFKIVSLKGHVSIDKKKRINVPVKMRALLQKEVNSKCPFCISEDVDHFQIHHIDENPENNEFGNLLMVCPLCHSKITKKDITLDEVLAVKKKLANKANIKKSNPSQSKVKIKGNVKHSIVANTITAETIVFKGKTKPKPLPHPESIEANLTMKNYIKHLIDRYQEFIKDDLYKGEKRFAQIWRAVKTEFGTDTYKIPQTKFYELIEYLQKRIKDTRIGRINNSRGQKLFSTFEEYKEKYT